MLLKFVSEITLAYQNKQEELDCSQINGHENKSVS